MPLKIDDSKNLCLKDHGNIVSIHTEEENFFVSGRSLSIISNPKFLELVARSYGNRTICWNTFWIGLHNSTGRLTWDDHSTVDFIHASLDESKNMLKPDECAYSHYGLRPHSYNGLWRSIKCQNCEPNCPKMAFVCKINI